MKNMILAPIALIASQARQVLVAEGQVTDQVIQALQKQINELQAQLKKAEQK